MSGSTKAAALLPCGLCERTVLSAEAFASVPKAWCRGFPFAIPSPSRILWIQSLVGTQTHLRAKDSRSDCLRDVELITSAVTARCPECSADGMCGRIFTLLDTLVAGIAWSVPQAPGVNQYRNLI